MASNKRLLESRDSNTHHVVSSITLTVIDFISRHQSVRTDKYNAVLQLSDEEWHFPHGLYRRYHL